VTELPEHAIRVDNADALGPQLRHESTIRVFPLVEKGELADATEGTLLRSVAEFELVGDAPMAPHRHPWPEFYYVLRGTGCVQVGDQARLIGPGDFVRIPSNQPHGLRPATDYGFSELPRLLAFSVAWRDNAPEPEACDLVWVEPSR